MTPLERATLQKVVSFLCFNNESWAKIRHRGACHGGTTGISNEDICVINKVPAFLEDDDGY